MSGFIQNLLKDGVKGFFGNEYLRDAQHASKTFRTGSYSYAPKFKFLFHVYFQINEHAIPLAKSFPTDKNFGLDVKSVSLPGFTFDVSEMNQYNRKRLVQTKAKTTPIEITFHDDNANLINTLWQAYYAYYYKDTVQAEGGESPIGKPGAGEVQIKSSERNIYNTSIYGNDDWGYVGEPSSAEDNGIKIPFFSSIKIYGFNQHNFIMYKIINPVITAFNHDTYNYSETNGIMENRMTLNYENIKYFSGAVDGNNPGSTVSGFGNNDHYDTTLSPVARPGSQSTILGQGGLVSGVGGALDDLAGGNILGAIQKAGATVNTFKKPGAIKGAIFDDLNRGIDPSGQPNPSRNTLFNFPTLPSSGSVNTSLGSVINKIKGG
jgi:hypothetical protein